MTPDQKMFVVSFVKQLHTCIEKHGVANRPASVSVIESSRLYSSEGTDNKAAPQIKAPQADGVKNSQSL